MKIIGSLLLAVCFVCSLSSDPIVLATKQIELEGFDNAFNPSLLRVNGKFLLSFRFIPDQERPFISYIGIVKLDEHFSPIAAPQLLSPRERTSRIPSHAEDARLFAFEGKIYLIYNDNNETDVLQWHDRRDMFAVELVEQEGLFSLVAPTRLVSAEHGHTTCQKNWGPFSWDHHLMAVYSINPHEILYVNRASGDCYSCYQTWAHIQWDYGSKLRGSSPPQLLDGEFLSFFHSGIVTDSEASDGWKLWHYFMGAYTFSPSPPFEITKISPKPIVANGFYTSSDAPKRVIFPGGFVANGPYLYLAYGKDDREIWIATLDKENLKKSLIPVAH